MANITKKTLQVIVNNLNKQLGRPDSPYVEAGEGRHKVFAEGHLSIEGSSDNRYKLIEYTKQGVRDFVEGDWNAREMNCFLSGLTLGLSNGVEAVDKVTVDETEDSAVEENPEPVAV